MIKKATPPVTEPLAARIRALRARSGLTVAEVVKRSGGYWRHPSGYHRWENEAKVGRKRKYISVEIAEVLWTAYKGTGNPPITREEVMSLAGLQVPPKKALERVLDGLTDEQQEQALEGIAGLLELLKATWKKQP